jgi:hypothetical protein
MTIDSGAGQPAANSEEGIILNVRKLVLSAGLALSAAGILPVAAATPYADSVVGAEYAVGGPSYVGDCTTQLSGDQFGSFAGSASGMLPGVWQATIFHTSLNVSAEICGGAFKLATVLNGQATTVKGTFDDDGSISLISAGPNCTNQQYAVSDTLTLTSPQGKGVFNAVLTHYRTQVPFFGCVIYAASVAGPLTLEF